MGLSLANCVIDEHLNYFRNGNSLHNASAPPAGTGGAKQDRRNESRAVRSYTIGELYTVYHHIVIDGKKNKKKKRATQKNRKKQVVYQTLNLR